MSGIVADITIGAARLILGDMRDALPALAAHGVRADCVVSDAPYRLTSGGNAVQTMRGIFAHGRYDNSGDLMAVVRWDEIGGPIFRACAADADCYIMANDKNLFAAHGGFTGAGWKFHNLLVWDKVRATRNRWYMKNCEFTLYLWKGQADKRGIADCGSKQSFNVFELNAPRETAHETEKPVALMAHYIGNSTGPGDMVLDPFMGSGSTLVAAVGLGRRAIGIEIERKWFEVACARVAAVQGLPVPDFQQLSEVCDE